MTDQGASRDWSLFLQDMRQFCRKVTRYTAGLSAEEFASNEIVYDAVLRNLELLGEATKQIPGAQPAPFLDQATTDRPQGRQHRRNQHGSISVVHPSRALTDADSPAGEFLMAAHPVGVATLRESRSGEPSWLHMPISVGRTVPPWSATRNA